MNFSPFHHQFTLICSFVKKTEFGIYNLGFRPLYFAPKKLNLENEALSALESKTNLGFRTLNLKPLKPNP